MAAITEPVKALYRSGTAKVFRTLEIKRREVSTGLYESEWLNISDNVKKWGKIKYAADPQRPSKIKFNDVTVVVANDDGEFSENDNESSHWFGYMKRTNTLVRISYGYWSQTPLATGGFRNKVLPVNAHYVGLLSGDLNFSEKNDVTLKIAPMMNMFRNYPIEDMTLSTATMSSSDFTNALIDHTDGAGNAVFTPMLTSTLWFVTSTPGNFNLVIGEGELISKSVYDVIEKLDEASNAITFHGNANSLYHKYRETHAGTAASYHFYGRGFENHDFGITIKSIDSFGPKLTSIYKKVQLKWKSEDTQTSYESTQSTFVVSGSNESWEVGFRQFNLENLFVQDTAAAKTLVGQIYDDLSVLRNEIKFTTTFICHVELFDIIGVSYSSLPPDPAHLWDQRNWDVLIWSKTGNGGLELNNDQFTIYAIEYDLDKFEAKFTGREIL